MPPSISQSLPEGVSDADVELANWSVQEESGESKNHVWLQVSYECCDLDGVEVVGSVAFVIDFDADFDTREEARQYAWALAARFGVKVEEY